MTLRIKNWEKFQHFKDRRPPWIKLYREILDDREWHKLDGEAAKLLTMLWLLASENDGDLPCVEDIAFRIRLDEQRVAEIISRLSHWLEQDDISAISDRYQSDIPETETETETEQTKAQDKPARFNPLAIVLPDTIPFDDWRQWIAYRRERRLTCSERTIRGQIQNLSEWSGRGHRPGDVIKTSIDNGWQGLFEPKGGINGNDTASVIAAFTGTGQREPAVFQGTAERVD